MRMLMTIIVSGMAFGSLAPQAAPDPPTDELELLAQMSGCFEVTYRFVEDGERDALSPDYGLEAPVTEWIGFERRDDGAVVQPHVGVLEGGRLLPHFQEVWHHGPSEGHWRHEVRAAPGPDGEAELRYACESGWEMNRWECSAGRAEKPFRDSGAPFGFDREDYDWLDRTNILLVTPRGWIHNQHNRKMKEDGELVSYELGWITYRRIDEAKCGAAPTGAGMSFP